MDASSLSCFRRRVTFHPSSLLLHDLRDEAEPLLGHLLVLVEPLVVGSLHRCCLLALVVVVLRQAQRDLNVLGMVGCHQLSVLHLFVHAEGVPGGKNLINIASMSFGFEAQQALHCVTTRASWHTSCRHSTTTTRSAVPPPHVFRRQCDHGHSIGQRVMRCQTAWAHMCAVSAFAYSTFQPAKIKTPDLAENIRHNHQSQSSPP